MPENGRAQRQSTDEYCEHCGSPHYSNYAQTTTTDAQGPYSNNIVYGSNVLDSVVRKRLLRIFTYAHKPISRVFSKLRPTDRLSQKQAGPTQS